MQESQPRISTHLVRAQCPAKPTGCGKFLKPRVTFQLRQKIRNPSGCRDAVKSDFTRYSARAQGHLDDLAHGTLVCGLLFPESKRCLDLLSIHLDPLAPHFDQRLLEFCQSIEFFERERLIAKG